MAKKPVQASATPADPVEAAQKHLDHLKGLQVGYKNDIQRHIGHVAAKLRETADNIERRAAYEVQEGREFKPVDLVATIQSEIGWSIANLALADIIRESGQYTELLIALAEAEAKLADVKITIEE